MQRPTNERIRRLRVRHPAARRGAYVLFSGAVVLVVAGLAMARLLLPARALPPLTSPVAAAPLASIQLAANNGVCRHLFFHNDSGQFQEGGIGPCRGMIPAEMLVETIVRRNNALSKVFKRN
jgi:hypothetical protein